MARAEQPTAAVLAVLAVAASVALAIGLAAQAVFLVREVHDQLAAPLDHPMRNFLEEANRAIPAGAPFAATSYRVSDAARYLLYPRPRVQVTSFRRRALRAAGVRYVIVTPLQRPPALTGAHDWYRVVLATPQGRVLEVTP